MSEHIPAPQDSRAWPLPDTDPGTAQRFGIVETREIGWTLQGIVAARAPVTLYRAGDFEHFLVSRLLGFDHSSLRFDFVDDSSRGAPLLSGGDLIAVALIDRIKLQFEACEPHPLQREGFPELVCAFPQRLVRIQRRQAYRVQPPRQHAARCRLRGMPGGERCYDVHDISVDGLALDVPAGQPAPRPGEILHHCLLEIAGLPPIPCELEVRTHHPVAPDAQRVGCSFHRPVAESQRAIQCYVIEVQRNRGMD